jgi:hypothetical protein
MPASEPAADRTNSKFVNTQERIAIIHVNCSRRTNAERSRRLANVNDADLRDQQKLILEVRNQGRTDATGGFFRARANKEAHSLERAYLIRAPQECLAMRFTPFDQIPL